MTIRQSQFVAPVPLILATELDLMSEGALRAVRTSGSTEQLRALIAEEIDVAVTAIDNLFEWSAAGASLRLVAQMEATTPLRLYAHPGTSALAELEGRRFAVDAYSNGFALVARRLLAAAGVQVEFVEVGGVQERLHSLIAGETSATLLGPPLDRMAEQAGMVVVADVNELLPSFPGQGLIVRTKVADSEEFVRYLAVLDQAVSRSLEMTDADGIALLERHGFQSAAETAWLARPTTLAVSEDGLALLTDIREELGLLPRGISLTSLSNPGPLRRVAEADRH